ncbi:alpha/beta fold hydrolase [Herbidospora sp. NEAU-GS84]|uniref:Alpha/beta fold hydrolase n=1 Tax=Herbidospora solisilvae TaxID=2696284 RepID=A0A7C9NP80_9ACTN|nr:alpha/beta hydrolase [Herbidospora solisilvae]NAS23496.1 alpha/beta fold hydrolase [Herbidospora solisilvae]
MSISYVEREGGRIAYEVDGDGPLVVLAHGMGDSRKAFRFLAPKLVAAGYRVASVDLRGHGDSSTGWASYTRTDTANDLLALIRELGGPAVVVGHSFAGGSATIAAVDAPELVSAVVLVGPFTRAQKTDFGALLRNGHHRRGIMLLMATAVLRSGKMWKKYLDHAYPGPKPADWQAYLTALETTLHMDVVAKMGMNPPVDADKKLPLLKAPALVVMGDRDPDWGDPRAEAEGIVATMQAGAVTMIPGAGHYPHAQFPDRVAEVVLPFLAEHTRG